MLDNLIQAQSTLDLFLIYTAFFCFSMLTFTFFKKTSIWYCVKAEKLSIHTLINGAFALFSSLMFSLALAWSGPMVFLIVFPAGVLIVLTVLSLLFSPIVFGGLLAKYFFMSSRYGNSKNILYATVYLFLISLLPASISSVILALLFIYVYGISANYTWALLTKNHNVI